MERRMKTMLFMGGITIAATAAIFFLCIHDWSGIAPWSALFLVWAEVALFGGLMLTERLASGGNQIILRSSYGLILPCYSLAVFALSLLFLLFLRQAVTAFWVLQILLFAVSAVLLVLFHSVSRGASRD